MAVTISKKRKKPKRLLLILIIIIIIVLGVVWKSFLAEPKTPSAEEEKAEPLKPKVEINFKILENPRLGILQLFEEIPTLAEEEIGRENPFLPY